MAIPQKFSINLGGTIYGMRLTYCPSAACWVGDISDVDGNPLVNGVPLITGAYLLSQYAYLGFKGDIYVESSPDPDAVPNFGSLGTGGKLYFLKAA